MLLLFVIVIWTSPAEGIVVNEQEEGTFKVVDTVKPDLNGPFIKRNFS